KGASLRLLRWKRFVQGDEEQFMANTRRFTELTGVKVRVDSENRRDRLLRIDGDGVVLIDQAATWDLRYGACSPSARLEILASTKAILTSMSGCLRT
ncbi:MAG TPA: hypothetical protein VE030_08100, partial [Burkholderiales bacterium]|nr:hypothetical protein [Burkholderiales bacterium]